MSSSRPYLQHSGKVISADGQFKHVMAITLDPTSGNTRGVARCIVSREGDLTKKGYIDRSELHLITGDSLEQFTIGERLVIKNEQEVIQSLLGSSQEWDFIGLEDPDIWIDPDTHLVHLYFTIPFIPIHKTHEQHPRVSLGHAVGPTLDTLEMTAPALECDAQRWWSAKEVSIAPENSSGVRLNLVESSARENGRTKYSVVRVAVADDMNAPWHFGDLVFHPAEHNIAWVGGHASPGPLLPRSFLDMGEGRAVGIMNGREANIEKDEETLYGEFSVGLFIYDYEHGKIEWVSPEPLIQDSEAKTITFASQFVETTPGEGILYAHVDDSFVRAYTLYAEGIRALLP